MTTDPNADLVEMLQAMRPDASPVLINSMMRGLKDGGQLFVGCADLERAVTRANERRDAAVAKQAMQDTADGLEVVRRLDSQISDRDAQIARLTKALEESASLLEAQQKGLSLDRFLVGGQVLVNRHGHELFISTEEMSAYLRMLAERVRSLARAALTPATEPSR